jgi:4-aminobutyrate aminotransferase-like enzyme
MSNYIFSLEPIEVTRIQTKNRIIQTKIPCPETRNIVEKLSKYESRSMHGQLPIVWEKAEDFSVYDPSGNKWIDFTSTIFVANIGHANKHLVSRVTDILNKPLLATYVYANRFRSDYLEKLIRFAGPNFEKAFLLSAGTEATEAASKLMKLYGRKIDKKSNLIVSVNGNWHGRTMGAQLLASNKTQREWINVKDEETVQIPFPYPWEVSESDGAKFARDSFNNLESKGVSIKNDICGVMLETFQGWAAAFYPKSYVQEIRSICDDNGILICFDEMQSGFGRTGKNFGYEHYDVRADLICCGKGMGGGFPISGVIGKAEIMDLPEIGNMSSTHSGNPVMSVAGMAVLEEIESKNLIYESSRKGQILHNELNQMKEIYSEIISSIQGYGMIAAIIFKETEFYNVSEKVSELAEVCMQKGLLIVHTGRESIKIGPPLTITEDALIEGLEVLNISIEKVFRSV